MEKQNAVEKFCWTDNEFENMNWHDNYIHAITFNEEKYELLFDIDYIDKWISPSDNEKHYNFLIVPSTLVFYNVYNLNMSVDDLSFRIEDIFRDNPARPKNSEFIKRELEYDWTIEMSGGYLKFKSVGYKLYVRKKIIFYPMFKN
jgi:hypothetical protein